MSARPTVHAESSSPVARRRWPWRAGLVLLALWLALVLGLEPARRLDLVAVQQALGDWQAWRAGQPVQAAVLFAAVYLAVATLALPGAAVLSLVGGALFGLGWGTALVLVCATVGATASMLISRHLLGPWVAGRWGAQLQAVQDGLARDGARFLLSLRLLPVVPFFLLNLLMGLVPLRTRTYLWVSALGMLPATVVYVNAGQALAQIRSLDGLLSPAVLASLVLLAALPWVSRAIAGRTGSARQGAVAAAARKPRRFDRNLIVIGGGAGGLVTAYMAAALKARVTLVEAERLGGDCLYTGCVPSKALIHAARTAEQVRQAHRVGVKVGAPEIDWPAIARHLQSAVQAIEPHDSIERYTGLGVDVVQGRARLLDPWTVEIQTAQGLQRLSARHIVLATGAEPVRPELPGLEQLPHACTDTLWRQLAERPQLPRRMLVLGGGAVGCELAQAFARLGVALTLVEQGAQLLAREDEDVAAAALEALQASGVQVHLSSRALRCEDGRVWLQTPQGEQAVATDFVLAALGRRPRLQGLGLESLGLEVSHGLATDASQRTAVPSLLAVGDAAGPWQLTHAAAHQGWHAALNALLGLRLRADRAPMPQTLFLDPEIARIGLNEREVRARGLAHDCTRFDLAGLDRAITDGQTTGFIKLITAPGSDRLLGVTIVGAQAGELLAEYALAMRHGLGLNKILASTHAYPTLAEANKAAAGVWKRAHQPAWALRLLERWHAYRRG